MAASITRVLIQESAGGMTQIAGLVSAFAIFWACLGSIIVVAMKDMLVKVFDMIAMWKVSKIDAMLWTVTASAVVLIDVDFGLLIGVLMAIAVLVIRGQHPKITKLGQLPGTDLYLDINTYKKDDFLSVAQRSK
ncbi:hypothetical protein HAZT_HAZT003092 [Hyalella azteca]|uniref:SLC26A/SulP transporter domain-containing protein n=1 Tax=Hyalella azteca TaxID=294128 RepID=A0A6A0GWR6_HYAAZ|nr:hypothetical protein HAZT_HAZT003092 [Hyalella azteca]